MKIAASPSSFSYFIKLKHTCHLSVFTRLLRHTHTHSHAHAYALPTPPKSFSVSPGLFKMCVRPSEVCPRQTPGTALQMCSASPPSAGIYTGEYTHTLTFNTALVLYYKYTHTRTHTESSSQCNGEGEEVGGEGEGEEVGGRSWKVLPPFTSLFSALSPLVVCHVSGG